MNHSFKKNIAFTFLTLVGILSLTSCKDSDMEVFVAQDTRNQELIEAIKAIPEPKKEVADKDIEKDKDYIYLMPNGYTDYIKSNNGSRDGYYGYVDLGLSVKWATKNFITIPFLFMRTSRKREEAMPGEHSATGHKSLIAIRTLPRI